MTIKSFSEKKINELHIYMYMPQVVTCSKSRTLWLRHVDIFTEAAQLAEFKTPIQSKATKSKKTCELELILFVYTMGWLKHHVR